MIIEGSKVGHDLTLRAEIVIVGSGAGGAVMARELALAGHDVLVLEEGPHITPQEYGAWRPTRTMHRLGRAGGTTAVLSDANTPTLGVMMGACVGGSSTLTGGVCYRIPDDVHARWVELTGTEALSAKTMQPHYERVEQMCNIHPVPESMRSLGTRRFGEGAARLGAQLQAITRNTRGCCGCSKCNYGCPHQAKLSVDLTYLPDARQHGATIYADMRCERVIIENGRAVGVEGVVLRDPDRRPRHRFKVIADHVVLAAGSLYTPQLLLRSRVGTRSGMVGKNLSLHPGFGLFALFDEPIYSWRGAMQSASCYHPEDPHVLYNSIAAPPNMIAGFLPGVGPDYMRRIREELPRMAMFGGLIHDASSGRVLPGLGREPIVQYRMGERDRASFVRGMQFGIEAFLLAGAHTVFNPVVGQPAFHSVDELRAFDFSRHNLRGVQSMSYHPLGTCQMGTDPARAVVDPDGQSFEVARLWIADGSVFPTSVGVNSQQAIMTLATHIAFAMQAQL